ncbi:MAG: acetate--CoA ligase family protein [Planctomycetota bacterium]
MLESVLALKENQVPIYRFPEGTALVLSALRRRQRWLERPPGVEVEIKARAADARAIVEEAASRGESWMPAADAFRLLDCYGIPTAPPHPITTSGAVPAGLEFPVVLKASGEGIVHKTEIGAVRSGIDSAEELESARSEMRSVLAEHGIDPGGVRFLAQRQVPQGREVIFGLRTDVTFSPLLIFGLGGIHVEVLKDVACRNHPITDQDAREMVRSLRGQAILDGVRGDPPADYALLESILLRLNRLTGDLTELIESLEVNPFIVHETGGAAVDCRVRLRRRS